MKLSRLPVGATFSESLLKIFHLIRRMRNCHIHSGGRADAPLLSYMANLNQQAHSLWVELTHEPIPELTLGSRIIFKQNELGATLAVTKRLADEANLTLATTYPRQNWADQMVSDWRTEYESSLTHRDRMLRKVLGFSKMYYGTLGLTESEVTEALKRAGLAD